MLDGENICFLSSLALPWRFFRWDFSESSLLMSLDSFDKIFRVFFALRGARNTAFQVTYDLIISISCHFRDIFAHADFFVITWLIRLTIIEELVIFAVDVHWSIALRSVRGGNAHLSQRVTVGLGALTATVLWRMTTLVASFAFRSRLFIGLCPVLRKRLMLSSSLYQLLLSRFRAFLQRSIEVSCTLIYLDLLFDWSLVPVVAAALIVSTLARSVVFVVPAG